MALPNYLDLTNEVLVRLREPEASSVSDNAYVKLIARYINDSKRQVEDAYNWNALYETITVTTSNNGRSKRPPLPTAASSSCSRHKFSHKYSPHWRYRAKTPLVH